MLYAAMQMIAGKADARGRRFSDLLNEPMTAYVSVSDAILYDLLSNGEPSARMGLVTLRKDAVQLAMPSDPLDIFRPRIPTEQLAIEVATSFFRVRGSLNRRATDPTNLEQLLSGHSRKFVALSNATIRCLANPQFDFEASTVLLNTEHVHCWWTVASESC